MYCPKCGNLLAENSHFCPSCGASIGVTQAQVTYPYVDAEPTPAYPMKWFKFLIYFSLFFAAATHAFTGIRMLTGAVYGSEAELIYATIENLRLSDIVIGVLMLICAALCLFTRFQLSGYKKIGPLMLTVLYGYNIAISLIYIIGIMAVLPSEVRVYMDLSTFGSDIAVSVAVMFVNRSYFNKRADLFVN